MLNGSTPVSDVPALPDLCVSVLLRHCKLWSNSSAVCMFRGVMPPHCAAASPLICSLRTLSSGSHTTATVIIIRALLRLLLFCCISVCVCVCACVRLWLCVCAHACGWKCVQVFMSVHAFFKNYLLCKLEWGQVILEETVVFNIRQLDYVVTSLWLISIEKLFPRKLTLVRGTFQIWSLMMSQDRWYQMSE